MTSRQTAQVAIKKTQSLSCEWRHPKLRERSESSVVCHRSRWLNGSQFGGASSDVPLVGLLILRFVEEQDGQLPADANGNAV